eukprot:GHVL01035661.1.p1 GENE.GHVL01035661.1~~GHVL01035661.1.p1  ORF type:complete len:405 (+),score=124.17 GHVL01035661.1:103-1215(+)
MSNNIFNKNEFWTSLEVSPSELRPSFTLTTGQCFNWIELSHDTWIGVIDDRVILINETELDTQYRCLHGSCNGLKDILTDFFQLKIRLTDKYEKWSKNDNRIKLISKYIIGCRIIQQDPIECFFSFICSSNNNINRITNMLKKLRKEYGKLLINEKDILNIINNNQLHILKKYESIKNIKTEYNETVKKNDLLHTFKTQQLQNEKIIKNEENNGKIIKNEENNEKIIKNEENDICDWKTGDFYSFPTVSSLANASEKRLRELGFGYRASYIIESAVLLESLGGREWLIELKNLNRTLVQEKLMMFKGIGRKVADCICLFSLNKSDVIPVDTHVWRMACRDFEYVESKTLTPTVYEHVGDLFRNRICWMGA